MLFKKNYSLFYSLAALICIYSCSKGSITDNEVKERQIVPSSTFIAVFGDIQYTTNPTYISVYKHSIDWLVKKANEGWQFNSILHTGDITNNNLVNQWECFYAATNNVAHIIPFYSMIGNHDYSWEQNNKISDRNNTHFNDYVQFPLSVHNVIDWYEDGKMENIVVENTINNDRLDLMILEFGPRKEVVAWADAYLKAHPEDHFILMTHEYLEKGGGRRTSKTTAESQFVNTSFVTPDQLWNNLIKCNDNVRLVLCGHVGGLYAITVDINDFGREIPQIQHNIQSADYRYDNWLMLWEFPVERDSANVFIYNTKTYEYYDNNEILFKFRYRDE